MEFKIKQSNFLEALRWTQNIAEKKTTMPVLSNVLLSVEGKALNLLATDLELSINITCPCQVLKKGQALVNAKGLFDIVREAPDKEITIHGEKESFEISSGRSQFKVLGMPPSEFPNFPDGSSYQRIDFSASQLLEMVDRTAYAVSTDETRYALNGIYLEKIGGGKGAPSLRMVATDGHRLSYVDREVDKSFSLDNGVIVPRKALALLRKLAEDSAGNVQLGLGEREIMIVNPPEDGDGVGVTLFVRLIEGKYPKYEQVIPKKNDRIVSISRDSLAGALRRASIMAQDRSHSVRFSLSSGHLEIHSSNPDLGEAKEEMDADYKGDAFQVGFNAKYFLDVLNVVPDEKVVLELGDELSPCVIRSEFDRGLLALVMPMRL